MDSHCSGNVLIVGDGDFSYTVSLMKNSTLVGSQVTTSTLPAKSSIEELQLGSENINFLTELGVAVLFETDACELHSHPVVSQKKYEKIIFNFPLADRHNIKKNRALLADFFTSCNQILVDGGQIHVTLCKGQGGTPADQPLRSWHDSWQILAMAANVGFLLTDVMAFDTSHFPGYHSTGFRFQDKSFNTEGALTHIFEKADTVQVEEDLKLRGIVTCGDSAYSCCQYLAEKVGKNLLQNEDNPLCILRKRLEKSLSMDMRADVLHDQPSWQVLPGHTSRVFLNIVQDKESGTEIAADVAGLAAETAADEKERKNECNLMMKASLLKHGVDETYGTNHPASNVRPHRHFLNECILHNPEAVYILLKNKKSIESPSVDSDGESDMDGAEDSATSCMCMTNSTSHPNVLSSKYHQGGDQLFHFRTSLLENLTELLFELESQSRGTELPHSEGVVFSGQCFSACPITPNQLPCHHELALVVRVSSESGQLDQAESSLVSGDQKSGVHFKSHDNYESMVDALDLSLHNSGLFTNHPIHIENYTGSDTINVRCADCVSHTKLICLESSFSTDSCQEITSKAVGIIFKLTMAQTDWCVAVIKLDTVALSICDIIDPRLLHSESQKFGVQFQGNFFPKKFVPFSLYPMKFVHDLSFWENGDFSESEMYDIVRDIAEDIVVNIILLDVYADAGTGRKSRCYRLHFLSHSRVLSYLTSWKLQSLIRLSVAQKLGVTLR